LTTHSVGFVVDPAQPLHLGCCHRQFGAKQTSFTQAHRQTSFLQRARIRKSPIMLFAVFFAFWRFMEIITLIPTMGMLAYFVDNYVKANQLTPTYILLPFIVSVLGLAWAIFTLFSYHRSSTNATFVAIIDLGFIGAFIASAWYLRFMASADCTHISLGDPWVLNSGGIVSLSGPGVDVRTDKTCAMLKAVFAFVIMNCIFFAATALLAFMHGGRMSSAERDRHVVRRTTHRHSHSHSRHGSRHGSRRSSHSHHRVYV